MSGLTFAQLSDKAKAYVRDQHRDMLVFDEWWDAIYTDAMEVGERLGFTDMEISFNGFSSQGDGASFTGRYACVEGCIEKVKSWAPEDETLHAIAEALTTAQVAWKLQHNFTWSCDVDRPNTRYSHSGSMATAWDNESSVFENIPLTEQWAMDEIIETQARLFADWIYAQLEAEYDHATSDETLDEQLTAADDMVFDEDGRQIVQSLL